MKYKLLFSYLFFIMFISVYPYFAAYDPLSVQNTFKDYDLIVHDSMRGRDVPIYVFAPVESGNYPVVLFSHGLGGSRLMGQYLGKHWAERGYVAVYIQHPGSDDSIWKGKARAEIIDSLKDAVSIENFILRVDDVKAVLDQLAVMNGDAGSPLFNKLNLDEVAMTGHSFGAVTTQAVSGQLLKNGTIGLRDARIKAAVIFSPSSPMVKSEAERSFSQVDMPWLLMTGTDDVVAIANQTVDSRKAVFKALPEGSKYQVVLNGAEHSAFTDRALPGDKKPRNPNHHRSILALSTAFLDAFLKSNQDALNWLNGIGPSQILDKADVWSKK